MDESLTITTKERGPNSFHVNPSRFSINFNTHSERERIIKETLHRKETVRNLRLKFAVFGWWRCEIDTVRITSTFNRFIGFNGKFSAIELHKFACFPISVLLIIQQNPRENLEDAFLENTLPRMTDWQTETEFSLEMPKNVYETIKRVCVKSEKKMFPEKKKADDDDELNSEDERGLLIAKPISVIVLDTETNRIRGRADINNPRKGMKKLKKMLKESVPDVFVDHNDCYRRVLSRTSKDGCAEKQSVENVPKQPGTIEANVECVKNEGEIELPERTAENESEFGNAERLEDTTVAGSNFCYENKGFVDTQPSRNVRKSVKQLLSEIEEIDRRLNERSLANSTPKTINCAIPELQRSEKETPESSFPVAADNEDEAVWVRQDSAAQTNVSFRPSVKLMKIIYVSQNGNENKTEYVIEQNGRFKPVKFDSFK